MLQLAADLRLLEEPSQDLRLVAVLFEQDLERQLAIQARVATTKDRAHAAPGDLVDDGVAPAGVARDFAVIGEGLRRQVLGGPGVDVERGRRAAQHDGRCVGHGQGDGRIVVRGYVGRELVLFPVSHLRVPRVNVGSVEIEPNSRRGGPQANSARPRYRAIVDIRERFGFAVKDRRESLRLTQEEFAERAGIHRTYLSDIERGTRNLSLINIERVALALSLKISELFQLCE